MLLTSGMSESLHHSKPIPVPHTTHSAFLKVLEYLYTGTITALTGDDVVELLITSELYMLDGLGGKCEDFIRQNITPATSVHLLLTR